MTDVEVVSLLLERVQRAGVLLLEACPGLRWVELHAAPELLRSISDVSSGQLLPDFPVELSLALDPALHPVRVVLRPAFWDAAPLPVSFDVFALPLDDASHEVLVALVGDGLPVDAALGLLPTLLA